MADPQIDQALTGLSRSRGSQCRGWRFTQTRYNQRLRERTGPLVLAFAAATLVGAALLFIVQPLVARLLLPLLGGSPSVWNTCMLFFQTALLLGYGYAHVLTRRFTPRVQIAVHLVVVAAGFATLPIAVRGHGAPSSADSPVAWLLAALALAAGIPFFVVSTTGPLIQRWLAMTDHASGRDPYFLYAASNLGSLGGLLAYPLMIEPNLHLTAGRAEGPWPTSWPPTQTGLWSLGYAVFAALVVATAVWTLRRLAPEGTGSSALDGPIRSPAPSWRDRLAWALFAFVPSSLLLGTTQYVTSDIAAIPLFWVVPLALYLATFIVAFSGTIPRLVPVAGVALAVLVAAVAAVSNPGVEIPLEIELSLYLATLTAAALVAHGRLAAGRPATDRLTEFYLWVAIGGALGGTFNAIVAPLVLPDLWEYPIALGLACFLRPRWSDDTERSGSMPRLLDAAVAIGLAGLIALLTAMEPRIDALGQPASLWLMAGLPALLGLASLGWRRRFALVAVVLLGAAWVRAEAKHATLHRERTFFGVHRVLRWDGPPFKIDESSGVIFRRSFHVLIHGGTRHGSQALDARLAGTPTTYYSRSGPLGQVFDVLRERETPLRVALVGLGAGTTAAYAAGGDAFTIYEIDPAVVRIASDDRYFTYLRNAPGRFETIIGDGRLNLARAPDGSYDLIVVDAFSSDSIPVHLLTREAVAIYLRKLAPGGLVAFHLSNQYLKLVPVVEAIVADLGVPGAVRFDKVANDREWLEGKDDSWWAVLAADPAVFVPFGSDDRWTFLPRDPSAAPDRSRLWTDDFSNVLGALR